MRVLDLLDLVYEVCFLCTAPAVLTPLAENLPQLTHLQFLQLHGVPVNLPLCIERGGG